MMQTNRLQYRFVETVPEMIEPGILYVSMDYATAAHRCCCGCGEEVVTPFSPAQWQMTFDGDEISLYPSIGNWNFRCRSHYFIREGRVIEAPRWSKKQIEAGRARDKEDQTRYLAQKAGSGTRMAPEKHMPKVKEGIWSELLRWFKSTFV
jgi:hypothetical protein